MLRLHLELGHNKKHIVRFCRLQFMRCIIMISLLFCLILSLLLCIFYNISVLVFYIKTYCTVSQCLASWGSFLFFVLSYFGKAKGIRYPAGFSSFFGPTHLDQTIVHQQKLCRAFESAVLEHVTDCVLPFYTIYRPTLSFLVSLILTLCPPPFFYFDSRLLPSFRPFHVSYLSSLLGSFLLFLFTSFFLH